MEKEKEEQYKSRLRGQAEEELRGKAEEEPDRLLQELRVHQVELEIQNEELRQAQLELQAARDKYADLYDFAPVGYFTISEKGMIQGANLTGATMLGMERAKLIGQPFVRFITRDTQDVFYLHRNKVSESKARQTCKLKLVKRGGTPFYAQLESIAVQDTEGNTEGNFNQFRTAITDITDLKRAEEALKEYSGQLEEKVEERTRELQDAQEQLVRKEKLAVLGQLAGGMAHELRNPLGAIKNAAYFLNMALKNPEPQVKETLEIMEKEVRTSVRIISSLLDFARSKPPTRRKVHINEVIQEAQSRTTVPDSVKVVSQLDEALTTIMADPEQLSQAFGNLILNAIQAMTEGGTLTINTKVESPEWVAISFTDTGAGIPREKLGKIFDPFFTTKAKGIGLGLAIAKTLVEEGHGGTIEVESPSTSLRAGEVGRGSTFTVKLPVG